MWWGRDAIAGKYIPIYQETDEEGYKYELIQSFRYYSPRYKKFVSCELGMFSDGATCATDLLESISWWVHDKLCERKTWDDGTRITNWQASMVLSDILKAEGRTFRYRTWKWMTFLFGGGGLSSKNGWIHLKGH